MNKLRLDYMVTTWGGCYSRKYTCKLVLMNAPILLAMGSGDSPIEEQCGKTTTNVTIKYQFMIPRYSYFRHNLFYKHFLGYRT